MLCDDIIKKKSKRRALRGGDYPGAPNARGSPIGVVILKRPDEDAQLPSWMTFTRRHIGFCSSDMCRSVHHRRDRLALRIAETERTATTKRENKATKA